MTRAGMTVGEVICTIFVVLFVILCAVPAIHRIAEIRGDEAAKASLYQKLAESQQRAQARAAAKALLPPPPPPPPPVFKPLGVGVNVLAQEKRATVIAMGELVTVRFNDWPFPEARFLPIELRVTDYDIDANPLEK